MRINQKGFASKGVLLSIGGAVFAVGAVLTVGAISASADSSEPNATPSTVPSPSQMADEPDAPTPSPTPSPIPNPDVVNIKVSFDPRGEDVLGSKDKVGVGVIPKLVFSKNIANKYKKDIAANYTVVNEETQEPVAGSWAWTGNRTLRFRPEKFWQGSSSFAVIPVQNIKPLKVTSTKIVQVKSKPQGWNFDTARSLIGRINANTKTMTIYVDGVKKKTFPVSLGKPGWETRSGIKVLSGIKEAVKTYTSDSLGLTNETYRLTAPWNIRLTPTGEFIHAAPWAYGRIGRYNGSHGCTNMFAGDAEWVYKKTIPGDVFVYKGTSKGMESWNGPGGLWNVSDKAWNKAAGKVLGS